MYHGLSPTAPSGEQAEPRRRAHGDVRRLGESEEKNQSDRINLQ